MHAAHLAEVALTQPEQKLPLVSFVDVLCSLDPLFGAIGQVVVKLAAGQNLLLVVVVYRDLVHDGVPVAGALLWRRLLRREERVCRRRTRWSCRAYMMQGTHCCSSARTVRTDGWVADRWHTPLQLD